MSAARPVATARGEANREVIRAHEIIHQLSLAVAYAPTEEIRELWQKALYPAGTAGSLLLVVRQKSGGATDGKSDHSP